MLVDAYHRGVDIKIVQNMPGPGFPDNDTKILAEVKFGRNL